MNLLSCRALVIVLASLILLSGCAPTRYFSNEKIGYKAFPSTSISVQKAIDLAKPYLEESYKLRMGMRKWTLDNNAETITYVSLIDDYFYIVKDNYPYKFREAYLPFAVRVHNQTGEVIHGRE